jgi:predicted transcriptional regulator
MRLHEVLHVAQAHFLSAGGDPEREVKAGYASDLMSDVLRYEGTDGLLITGLANPQVVRTAEMAEVVAILIVRGKIPQKETMDLAREVDVPVLGTELSMFDACGRLYCAGLSASRKSNGHQGGT